MTYPEKPMQYGGHAWEKHTPGQSHPGVYCLRTNQNEWDETTLWRTYTMLTDLEAVFRSLKSELGLRPIYHRQKTIYHTLGIPVQPGSAQKTVV